LRGRCVATIIFVGLGAASTACAAVIGVPDLFLEEAASGGDGGADAVGPDAQPVADGQAADVGPTCAADVKTDAKNCGACGHDCTNGHCLDGLCVLAENLKSPGSIALRGGTVYVGLLGGTGDIASCPTNGCASATVALKSLGGANAGEPEPYPWRIAATDTYVYASDYNNGGVWRAATNGGEFRRLVTPAEAKRAHGIALDENSVVWTIDDGAASVLSCDLPDCAGGAKTVAPAVYGEVIAVATQGASKGTLVWANNGGGELFKCPSRIGCAPAKLVVGDWQGRVDDLTIDGETVYWGTNLGEIFSCAVAGCANPTKILTEAPKAFIAAIAVRGTSLYWSSMPAEATGDNGLDGAGVVKKCTLPKCGDVQTIATKQKDPTAMTLDDRSVYWANGGRLGYTDGVGILVKAPR
jgi:hypothetical protein